MDFKIKYLKYKNKYNTLKNKINGGSYTLSKEVVVDHVGDEIKYIYPEVTIITSKTKIGSGGTGSVTLGRIENCILNPSLNGRQIAIKKFSEQDTKSKEKEKTNMLTYGIDEDGKIIENPLIASLYFDIKYGPLQNKLIYEYGGKTLSAYRYGVKEYSLENNKRILIDLFTIFAELVHKDNMHNDIKTANTVYSIEPSGVVKTKLIDFGSSRSISQMESGIDSFKLRTNMNSPEAISNYLHLNKWPDFEVPFTRNFKRWYYYPFISILYYLYTGIEYSTGDDSYMHALYGKTSESKLEYKFNCLEHLKNNDNIKRDLAKNIHIKEPVLLDKLNNIIDMMCILNPDERASEEAVLAALKAL